MLNSAIRSMKGEISEDDIFETVDMNIDAFIPSSILQWNLKTRLL